MCLPEFDAWVRADERCSKGLAGRKQAVLDASLISLMGGYTREERRTENFTRPNTMIASATHLIYMLRDEKYRTMPKHFTSRICNEREDQTI